MRLSLALLLPLFAASAAGQDDDRTYEREFNRGAELLRARKYAEGIAVYESLLKVRPNDSPSAYNLACGHALAGDKAKAFEWLARAADWGFDDGKLAETDTDLDSLRPDAAFAPILEKIRANVERAKAREEKAKEEAKVPYVHEPPNYDRKKPFPVLVVLHGAPGNKTDFAKNFEDVADEAGFLLLSVQGTVPGREKGYLWHTGREEYRRTPGRFENHVLEVVRQVKRDRAVDPERVYLAGFSQGAFMAFHAGLRTPGLFRGVIGIAGDYYPRLFVTPAGLKTAAERGCRAYLIAGEKDDPQVTEVAKRAFEELKSAAVRSELKVYPVGHEFPPDRKSVLLEALRWLDANAPPPASKPASTPSGGERRG